MKRKAIPQWIREALEKREKQKQKELAKQQEETSTPDEEQKDIKVDVKEEIKEEVEEKKPFFKIKKVRIDVFEWVSICQQTMSRGFKARWLPEFCWLFLSFGQRKRYIAP